MRRLAHKVERFVLSRLAFGLPRERRAAVERRLRGKEEHRKLMESDCVVVSYGKSGRTWLRVMLSRFYQLRHGLSGRQLIGFDNLHRANRRIPKLFFTHDTYLKAFTGNADSKVDYQGRRVILLVRHPADVAVSQFFQWRYRMRARKKWLNEYPLDDELGLFEFVMGSRWGVKGAVDFMNLWARESKRLDALMIVRYEDMSADPEATLARVLQFLTTPGEADEIHAAVAFASAANMRALEKNKAFWRSGSRLIAKDAANPDSYKVRRAKVGGYRDYFDAAEIEQIDDYIDRYLREDFGYGRRAGSPSSRQRQADGPTPN